MGIILILANGSVNGSGWDKPWVRRINDQFFLLSFPFWKFFKINFLERLDLGMFFNFMFLQHIGSLLEVQSKV